MTDIEKRLKEIEEDPHTVCWQDIDYEVKEVFDTKDNLTALEMIHSGDWKIIGGSRQGDEVTWTLVRFR